MADNADGSFARWSSVAVLLGSAALVVAGSYALGAGPSAATPPSTDVQTDSPASPEPPSAEPPEAAAWPEHVRWIAVGGGSQPDLNQISLEEDLLAVAHALGSGGVTLFAGGPGTRSVQVLADAERGDPLLAQLGEIFAPRGGRDARYQSSRIQSHGAATLDALLDATTLALQDGSEPLLIYVATHGDIGEAPNESSALLWGGGALDVVTLARTLDETPTQRRVRFVITSCYAGGFAELAFRDADASAGATEQDRCGVFATAWDMEASGCDPNPERAAHESWAAHFLPALEGRDRAGQDRVAQIDLDADGQVGVLEAYAFARAHSTSFDLPTTTSNRLLRVLMREAPEERARPISLPEEELIISVIGERLGLADEVEARSRLSSIDARRAELKLALEERAADGDDAWFALSAVLLSRWPVLDDPFHPDFGSMLQGEGERITVFLDTSAEYAAWLEAQDDLDAMSQSLAALEVAQAPLRRWLDATETLRMAASLAARGGDDYARWQRMRACEMATP